MKWFINITVYFVLGTASYHSYADSLNVAVASNFYTPMKHLVLEFEKKSEHKIKLIAASSGKIYAQVLNGAPFHIFLSADQIKPAQLEKKNLTARHSRITYAQGALALWSPVKGLAVEKAKILKTFESGKLAIANPRLAPYGVASIETLKSLNVYNEIKGRLVFGENIAQTYLFVATQNADLGLIALSQLINNGKVVEGSVWRIPQNMHQPILQDLVILKIAEEKKAAWELLDFLRSSIAQKIIQKYGYQTSFGID
ncbi:molybdate ABC transporter substrate-binding protein [Aliikangiella sp. IMCC44359]|uniref:molybdate ABC transporter substrate-binding protein n=1 Tax=Aliikangiella sp. IMCC44359 TaxID=3459125 RepID=UPI00403AA182